MFPQPAFFSTISPFASRKSQVVQPLLRHAQYQAVKYAEVRAAANSVGVSVRFATTAAPPTGWVSFARFAEQVLPSPPLRCSDTRWFRHIVQAHSQCLSLSLSHTHLFLFCRVEQRRRTGRVAWCSSTRRGGWCTSARPYRCVAAVVATSNAPCCIRLQRTYTEQGGGRQPCSSTCIATWCGSGAPSTCSARAFRRALCSPRSCAASFTRTWCACIQLSQLAPRRRVKMELRQLSGG